MTVLGENPGEEIIVSKFVADAGGITYDWNTGLPNVIAASAIGETGGLVNITGISGPTVALDGTVNTEPLYLIATGW